MHSITTVCGALFASTEVSQSSGQDPCRSELHREPATDTMQNPDLMPQSDELLRIRKGHFPSLTHRLVCKVRRLEYEVQDDEVQDEVMM